MENTQWLLTVSSLVETSLKHKHCGGLRSTTLSEFKLDHNCFELDDEENMPVTIIVDTEGFHITQQDYQGFEDHISLSWIHCIMGRVKSVIIVHGHMSGGSYVLLVTCPVGQMSGRSHVRWVTCPKIPQIMVS